jgi:hypothetical protein
MGAAPAGWRLVFCNGTDDKFATSIQAYKYQKTEDPQTYLQGIFHTVINFFTIKSIIMANSKPKEGKVAKAIEKETARIPSDVYLWTAVGTMALSLGLFLARKKSASVFFGQWAPSLLIMGLYNKLVKVEGHDQQDRGGQESYSEKEDVLSSSLT